MMKTYENFSDVVKVMINGGEEGFTAENFSAAAMGNKFYEMSDIPIKFAEDMHKEGPPEDPPEPEEQEGEE